MSVRETVLPALRATHPVLFAIGIAVVLVQAVLQFMIAAVRALLPPVVGALVAPVGTLAVLALTVPLSVALYVPVAERTESASATFRAAIDALGDHYVDATLANMVAFAVAGVGAVGATLCYLVVATVYRYVLYLTSNPGSPAPTRIILELQLVVAASFVLAYLATRFADVAVVFDDAAPLTAWRESAAFARRRPVSFAGYATLTLLLLGTASVITTLGPSVHAPTNVFSMLAVVVLVGSTGVVIAGGIHAEYYRRTVRPGLFDRVPAVPWARLGLAGFVVLAGIGGAGFVRTVDAGTGQSPVADLPEDPTAAYPVAANNTMQSNHRVVVRMRNESWDNGTVRTMRRAGVDRDDRQIYVYLYGSGSAVGGYYGEGTLATLNGDAPADGQPMPPPAGQTGEWSVLPVPGYGTVAQYDLGGVPATGVNWTLTTSNESTLVYRVEGEDQVLAALWEPYPGSQRPLAADSYVEVVVDREAGVLSHARIYLRSQETGHAYTYLVRYEEVGTADIERPTAIGDRGPVEWLWDIAYY